MKENWWGGLDRTKVRPGLDRIQALMDKLGHPERGYPIVHVAGTNGKGSTAALIAAGLASQGYRVGLTVSPDLGQINERVMLNRRPLEQELWDRLGEEIEAAGVALPDVPTFFEAVTAMAFLAFRHWQVDVAVVEVGLGGRLDATNIISAPCLAVITPVAFDHMDRLGDTIGEIAAEKAGIVKAGSRLVLGRQPYPEARHLILHRAQSLHVPVTEPAWFPEVREDGVWGQSPVGPLSVPLLGAYQAQNVATALSAMQVMETKGWVRDWDAVLADWARFTWPGRFQVMRRDPLWVIDGAHNPHGVLGVVETLKMEPYRRLRWTLVFGALADKPASDMLRLLLPFVHSVILTRIPSERAGDPALLQSVAPGAEIVEDPWDAVRLAISRAHSQDGVLTTGSLALLGYLLQQHRQFGNITG